jgi:hypothetical protein
METSRGGRGRLRDAGLTVAQDFSFIYCQFLGFVLNTSIFRFSSYNNATFELWEILCFCWWVIEE